MSNQAESYLLFCLLVNFCLFETLNQLLAKVKSLKSMFLFAGGIFGKFHGYLLLDMTSMRMLVLLGGTQKFQTGFFVEIL